MIILLINSHNPLIIIGRTTIRNIPRSMFIKIVLLFFSDKLKNIGGNKKFIVGNTNPENSARITTII